MNPIPGTTAARSLVKKVVTMLFALSLLVGAAPAAMAQEGAATNTNFLPLVTTGGAPQPDGLYSKLLARVQQFCSKTELNQVCYVGGEIALQAKQGSVTFEQPGDIADLASVEHLSLTSTGSDPDSLAVAWLRVAAHAATPGAGLTVLAFGNVELGALELYTGPADLEKAATLPGLDFASAPIASETKKGSSGLVVANPLEEDLLSITLNGATITLGSTALVEAKPGDKMTVTMADGFSRTEAGGGESTAVQNQQVSVPLDQNGKASGAPSTPRELSEDEWLEQMLDELLQKLKDDIQLANTALERLNRSIDRCIAGQARYVYNVLYWVRVIEKTPGLKDLSNKARLAEAYSRAANCLTFDLVFDTTATTTHPDLRMSSHLNTEGLSVQFLLDGRTISLSSSLTYVNYAYVPSASCGAIQPTTAAGELELDNASLAITGNKVRIATTVRVAKQPTDFVTITCPPAPPHIAGQQHWVSVFYHMHEDLWQKPEPSFRFDDWKYTAGEHFGEAIYVRTLDEGGFTFDTTTYLILVHTPVN